MRNISMPFFTVDVLFMYLASVLPLLFALVATALTVIAWNRHKQTGFLIIGSSMLCFALDKIAAIARTTYMINYNFHPNGIEFQTIKIFATISGVTSTLGWILLLTGLAFLTFKKKPTV
jgi:hypothetical protein